MSKRLTLEPHFSKEELETRYRQAKDPVERSHCQIIWLLTSGKTVSEVTSVTGYSGVWIRQLMQRYNQTGVDGLGDQRHNNSGAEPLLSDVEQAQLWQALQGPAPGGGLWSGPKVAAWMSECLGQRVWPQRGWEYLRGLEYRLKSPRPEHHEADLAAQEDWKKN